MGEPLTLRLTVTGSGNFDRVDSAMLDHVDHWKTYPPKSSYVPGDAEGRKGEKIFEQPLIASQAGEQSIPALTFSYFNPTARRYETARSSPLSAHISPPQADSTLTASQVSAGASAAPGTAYAAGLRPDHVVAGTSARSLVPLYLQPRFLAVPSLLALAFAGAWLGTGRRKDHAVDMPLRRRRLSKAANRALAQVEAASRSGDAAQFFSCTRSALQQTLAARWRLEKDRVTSTEVNSRMGSEGRDILLLFALADEAKYSGHVLHTTDYDRWMRIVRREVLVEETP